MLQFERHSLENVANLIREEENTMSEVEKVINKAKKSCKNSDISVLEHFVGADKMVSIK